MYLGAVITPRDCAPWAVTDRRAAMSPFFFGLLNVSVKPFSTCLAFPRFRIQSLKINTIWSCLCSGAIDREDALGSSSNCLLKPLNPFVSSFDGACCLAQWLACIGSTFLADLC